MIEFHIGPAPKGFKKDFESFLFNTIKHRKTQSSKNWQEFNAIDISNKKIVASVSFCINQSIAQTPFRAPFGSYEFSNSIDKKTLFNFVKWVDNQLLILGVQKIIIINPPYSYSKQHNHSAAALIANGYSVTECALSCSIPINESTLESQMNKGKRKQSKHGAISGFAFKIIPLKNISSVYRFIKNCRDERGQALSMTSKEIKDLTSKLPTAFKLFGVYQHKELVAASICIRINKGILYTFYSAHNKKYNTLSPLTFLLSKLYDWCQHNEINLIDMGTSMLGNKVNFKLLDYKLRVGGRLSPKFTFQKEI